MGTTVQIDPKDYIEESPESKEHFIQDNNALHIVLLGALGAGKSTLGNVLIGTTEENDRFPSHHKTKQETSKLQIKYSKENCWHVVDTPGVASDNWHVVDHAMRHTCCVTEARAVWENVDSET
jgi:putative ribosome biogenesis GTPase RsgA